MAQHLATSSTTSDARERALRTLWQSLGIDLVAGAGMVMTDWLTDADITSAAGWSVLGILVAKSALTSVASYLMRLKLAPAGAESETA